MDKEIKEFDRLKIGVREWAIGEASRAMHWDWGQLQKGGESERWKEKILGIAKGFEEFIMKDIEG